MVSKEKESCIPLLRPGMDTLTLDVKSQAGLQNPMGLLPSDHGLDRRLRTARLPAAENVTEAHATLNCIGVVCCGAGPK